MRKNSLVAAAVVGALASSAGHAATGPGTFGPVYASADFSIVMAGSSAARDALVFQFDKHLCDRNVGAAQNSGAGTDTLALFKVNNDLRAYSCQLLPQANLPASFTGAIVDNLGGKKVNVYYRSYGGSIMGVIGAIRGTQLVRADLSNTSNVTAKAAGSPAVTNDALAYTYGSISGAYTLTNAALTNGADSANITTAGGLTSDTVQLGVSDVGMEQFQTTANWLTSSPVGFIGNPLTTAEVNGASDNLVFGQIFGIVVNKNAGFTTSGSNVTDQSISSADVAGLFTGKYTAYGSVPSLAGTAVATNNSAITQCWRDQGSGSRVTIGTHFLNNGCGPGSLAFAGANLDSGTGTGPLFRSSTGGELGCVDAHTTAIGYSAFDDTAAFGSSTGANVPNVLFVKIDGTAPSKLNAATGAYPLWQELHIVTNPGNPGTGDNGPGDFLTAILAYEQTQPAPDSSSGMSLYLTLNTVSHPPASPNWTVLGQHGPTGGQACYPLQNQK